MSESDEIDINELKSIFGDAFDSFTQEKTKTKKSKKKSKDTKSKNRSKTKTRNQIDIQSIMDGVDLNISETSDKSFEMINDQQFNFQDNEIIDNINFDWNHNPNSFKHFESKVNEYLELSLNSLQKEFLNELEQILIDYDDFDNIIAEFIESLNHSIFSLIMDESVSNSSPSNHLYMLFDDYSDSYLEVFKQVAEFVLRSQRQNSSPIRSCRSLIRSRTPIFDRQLKLQLNDICKEINDIEELRKSTSSSTNTDQSKIKTLCRQQTYLEVRIKALDVMNEYILKLIENVQESKTHYFASTAIEFPSNEDLKRRLKLASQYFGSKVNGKENSYTLLKDKISQLTSTAKNLHDDINETENSIDYLEKAYRQLNRQKGPKTQSNSVDNTSPTSSILEQSRAHLKHHKKKMEEQFSEMSDFLSNVQKRKSTIINE